MKGLDKGTNRSPRNKKGRTELERVGCIIPNTNPTPIPANTPQAIRMKRTTRPTTAGVTC